MSTQRELQTVRPRPIHNWRAVAGPLDGIRKRSRKNGRWRSGRRYTFRRLDTVTSCVGGYCVPGLLGAGFPTCVIKRFPETDLRSNERRYPVLLEIGSAITLGQRCARSNSRRAASQCRARVTHSGSSPVHSNTKPPLPEESILKSSQRPRRFYLFIALLSSVHRP